MNFGQFLTFFFFNFVELLNVYNGKNQINVTHSISKIDNFIDNIANKINNGKKISNKEKIGVSNDTVPTNLKSSSYSMNTDPDSSNAIKTLKKNKKKSLSLAQFIKFIKSKKLNETSCFLKLNKFICLSKYDCYKYSQFYFGKKLYERLSEQNRVSMKHRGIEEKCEHVMRLRGLNSSCDLVFLDKNQQTEKDYGFCNCKHLKKCVKKNEVELFDI